MGLGGGGKMGLKKGMFFQVQKSQKSTKIVW